MKKRFLVLIIVLLAFGVGAFFWWKTSLMPVNPADKSIKTFVVNKGSNLKETIKSLHDQGLIRDQIAFFLLIKKMDLERRVQAGSFKLSPSLSAFDLANKLTVGTEDRWITILEGWRSEEILEYLQNEQIDSGNWTVQSQAKLWANDEGKLFPDTYLIPKEASIDYVHKLLTKTFEQRITDQMRKDASASGLTVDQVVILASLVEREARTDESRAMVADVILKRLKNRMALDIDASVQYSLGKQANGSWWKKELTLDDVKLKVPYNTYQNPGLPPGPICSPSLSAIKSVIYPTSNPYYFYITDKQGVMHYAKTLEEHNVNVSKYL